MGTKAIAGPGPPIGLADQPEGVAQLKVDWIGGGTDLWEDIPADRTVTVIEGRWRP